MGQRSGDERAAAELETGSSSGMGKSEETWDLNLLIFLSRYHSTIDEATFAYVTCSIE